jgi:rod shape determining protein RodA
VPEQSTDFIFCTIGEEFGFLGTTVFLLIYLVFILRIIYIAERQRSPFSRIYAYCVASIFFLQIMINVGMTIGLLPVIGIPLPFISYGGSSVLAFSVMVFILLRLDADRLLILR